jgi:Phage integrase, N-terminal SAM-like domain
MTCLKRITIRHTITSSLDGLEDRWCGISDDLHRPPHRTTGALAQYAKAWIEERPDLRPQTVQLYGYLLRRHLLPAFDSKSIAEIKEASVRCWNCPTPTSAR